MWIRLEVRVIHNSKCMMSDGTCSFMSGMCQVCGNVQSMEQGIVLGQ